MQHPAVAGVDGDAGVPAGMAWQRDKNYAGGDFVELLGRRESSPRFAFGAVFDNGPLRCPLLVAVSNLLLAGGRAERCECFGSGDVDLRRGKICAMPPT